MIIPRQWLYFLATAKHEDVPLTAVAMHEQELITSRVGTLAMESAMIWVMLGFSPEHHPEGHTERGANA